MNKLQEENKRLETKLRNEANHPNDFPPRPLARPYSEFINLQPTYDQTNWQARVKDACIYRHPGPRRSLEKPRRRLAVESSRVSWADRLQTASGVPGRRLHQIPDGV
ncbi:hypothetical protein Tco_1318045 [Tanacetum coccineum]